MSQLSIGPTVSIVPMGPMGSDMGPMGSDMANRADMADKGNEPDVVIEM